MDHTFGVRSSGSPVGTNAAPPTDDARGEHPVAGAHPQGRDVVSDAPQADDLDTAPAMPSARRSPYAP
jgi:hypothetical protein